MHFVPNHTLFRSAKPLMNRVFYCVVIVCSLAAASLAAEERYPPRLAPRGIPGGVIAVVGEAAWPDALVPFLALANQADKAVVIVCRAAEDASELEMQLGKAGAKGIVIHAKDSERDSLTKALGAAAGVWLLDDEAADDAQLRKELQAARERGAIIVGRPPCLIALCPGIAMLETDQQPAAGVIGLNLSSNTICGVAGRILFNHGPGEVKVQLARSPSREPRTIALDARQAADYNELQRAAWGRTQAAYPAVEIGVPEVKSGALVIVGGGGMPKEIAERFVELGGGAEGRFVVLPTAMPDPLPPGNEAAFLERFGAKHFTVIKARDQAELETPENLAAFDSATAIWFGGGRQWRFVDAYEGTKVYERLHAVLARGGVIGGSSAGATIQGEYLVRGAPAGPHIMMCEGYERGFNFLPGVAIDQHFKQRNRFADMTALMKVYPQYLGIGLDEATAIVVQGTTAEVLGRGEVHFYDRRQPVEEGRPDHQSVGAGKKYDLKERKVID